MTKMAPSIQNRENLEHIKNIQSFQDLCLSPYALSMSFMKNTQLIGKEDTGDISDKYNLNLDEELVDEYYKIITEDDRVVHQITSQLDDVEEKTEKALQTIHLNSILYFKYYIDDYLSESGGLEPFYQIVKPYVLRGLIIHLMNNCFDFVNQELIPQYLIEQMQLHFSKINYCLVNLLNF